MTSAISWRASFWVQVAVVIAILLMGRKYPKVKGGETVFDGLGALLSAAGLVFVVLGILSTGTYGWGSANQDVKIGDTVIISEGGIAPIWPLIVVGAVFLAAFFWHIRSRERAGREPLLSTRLFQNRTSNLGLVTQNMQWLILQGSFFVISVFLQTVRGYSAIETGLVLTASTVGLLISSGLAGRFACETPASAAHSRGVCDNRCGDADDPCTRRRDIGSVDVLARPLPDGVRSGVMLTSSVNVVQSSFPEQDQGGNLRTVA